LAASYLDELWQRSSGRIQFSEPRAVLTRDASQECEYLFEAFVGGDAPTAPAVRRSRLKTEVKKDLRQKNLLVTKAGAQLEMGRLTAFVENPVIARGYSKAEYTVDFACLNGSVVVVETVDLRKKSPREREHETFESAFKLDDLSRELKEGFSGYTVVATPHELPDSVEGYVKILKAYSEVYMYTVEEERSAFLKKIELLTGGRSASVQSFPSDSAR
jgi:hypothetical protein